MPGHDNQHVSSLNGQDVRERLLKAGVTFFARKGYAAATVREIVAWAGVTKPMLYYHFRNKEGLFRAIMDSAASTQDRMIAESLCARGPAISRITDLFARFYQGLAEHREISRMIHNLMFGPPQGAPDYDLNRFHRMLAEAVENIYKEALASGDVRKIDPKEAAYLTLGILDFCIHLDLLNPELHDPGRPGRLLDLAFTGLGTGDCHKGG
jgi:TetR/AcrR family transcriptional regulator